MDRNTGKRIRFTVELDGKRHGKQFAWYPSGNPLEERVFRNGLKIDTNLYFYESGELESKSICDHNGDSCLSTYFFPDGSISGGSQSGKGKPVGRSWSKYPDGKWRHITEYDSNGLYHGLRATWDSAGRPIDSTIYYHRHVYKTWTWYPGTRQLDNYWIHDTLDVRRVIEAELYTKVGKSQGKIVNGKGIINFLNEQGKVRAREIYQDSVLVRMERGGLVITDSTVSVMPAKKKKKR